MRFKYLRLVFSYLSNKKQIAWCLLMSVIVSYFSASVIYTFKSIIDIAVPARDLNAVIRQSIIILVYLLISFGASSRFISNLKKIEADVVYRIRQDVYKHLINVQYRYAVKKNFGRMNTSVIQDVEDLGKCIFVRLAESVSNILYFTVVFIMLLLTDVRLAVMLTVFFVVFTWYVGKLKSAMVKYTSVYSESRSKLNTVLIDLVSNAKNTQLYNLEHKQVCNVVDTNGIMRKNWLKLNIFSPLIQSSVEAAILISYLIIFACGMVYIKDGSFTYGDLTVFITFIPQLWEKYRSVVDLYNGMVQGEIYAKRIFIPIMEEPEEEQISIVQMDVPNDDPVQDGISINNIHLTFDNGHTLYNDLSVAFPKQGVCCLTGPSGCGKSTLFDVILGFYTVDEGHIFLDGMLLDCLSTQERCEYIGIVHQEALFIDGSILDNIRFYDSRYSDDCIRDAINNMGLQNYFAQLPVALDTPLKRDNKVLTYGQKRVISLVRILIRNTEYLLFDEVTAALDSYTELLVLRIIKQQSRNKGCIMISHKTSDEKIADVFVRMNNTPN